MTNDHEKAMLAAIAMAKQAPKAPFGAVLVDNREGKVVAQGVNRAQNNPTWHGEIDVINRYSAACAEPQWQHLTLYTTAEPCPMCMSAIAWAGIPQVVYGTDIPTLQQQGWNQLELRASDVSKSATFRTIELVGGVLKNECDRLFAQAQTRRLRAHEPSSNNKRTDS